MKNILAILLISTIFISCGSGDDEREEISNFKINIKETSIEIAFEDSKQLSVDYIDISKCQWTTENSFIASVYNGKVTANHVGITKVYATYQNQKDSCIITVNPKTNNVTFPITEWGISLNQLKSREKNKFDYESTGNSIYYIIYKNENSGNYLKYYFVNDKLVLSVCDVSDYRIKLFDVTNTLYEYYEHISVDNTGVWFKNDNMFIMAKERGGNGGRIVYFGKTIDIINSYK